MPRAVSRRETREGRRTEIRPGIATALAEIQNEMGFDPHRDVDRLTFAVGGFEEESARIGLIVRGRDMEARSGDGRPQVRTLRLERLREYECRRRRDVMRLRNQ